MGEFYTYLYLRDRDSKFPKGSVYYVGKGKGKRAFCNQRNVPVPPCRENIHVQHWPDEDTALAFERYLIDFYGRVDLGTGCLRNLTYGGDGHGHPSERARQIFRECGRRVGTMLYQQGRLPRVKDFATFESQSTGGKIGGKIAGKKNIESGHIRRLGRRNAQDGTLDFAKHVRWHVNRNIKKAECTFCKGDTNEF